MVKKYSISFDDDKKEVKNSKNRGKKFIFKMILNLGAGAILAGYNVHLIKEKIANDVPILESLEKDYETLKDIVGSPFLNVLKKAEGSSKVFYADNKGYATGYGFNPTQNTDDYNKEILTYAQVDPVTSNIIIEACRKYRNSTSKVIPPELKKIKFTQEQIDKMAYFAKKSYEHDFLVVLEEKLSKKQYNNKKKEKVLKAYKGLYENQQAVLIHMAYKVGQNNLRKYNNFFDLLINYLENPTIENKEQVAKKFIYHYKDNGKDKLDNRVSLIHYDEFMKIPAIKEQNKEDKKVVNKDNNPPPKLSDKEKWDKASKEVAEDWKLTNIFKKLKNNKAENSKNGMINNNPKANKSVETKEEIFNEDEEYEEVEYEVVEESSIQSLPKRKM